MTLATNIPVASQQHNLNRDKLQVRCDDDSSFDEAGLDHSLQSTDDDINSQEPSDDRTFRKGSEETTPTYKRVNQSDSFKAPPAVPARQSWSTKSQPAHLAEIAAQPVESIVLRSSETPTARALRIDQEREAKIKREAEERRKSQVLLLNQATKGLRSSHGSPSTTPRTSLEPAVDASDKSADELLEVVPQDNFKIQKSAVERFEYERAQQAAAAAEKKKREEEERIAQLTSRQQLARQQKEAERQAKKDQEEAAAAEAEAERLRKTEERRLAIVADMEKRRWEALSDDEKERELRMKDREAQRQAAIQLERIKKAEEEQQIEEERQRLAHIEAEKREQEALETQRQQEAEARAQAEAEALAASRAQAEAEAQATAQRKIEEEKASVLLQQQQQNGTTTLHQNQAPVSTTTVELTNAVPATSPAPAPVVPVQQPKAETACCIVM